VIGNVLERGVSGGEAKRVNIALALITEPQVIFLDEPTTGLDSHMANEVVSTLQTLAKGGTRTICATIHSPTSYAFGLFDELVLLKAGQVIFADSLEDQAQNAKQYFLALGFTAPVGIAYSTPEWLVELTSGQAGAHLSSEANSFDFAAAYQQSDLCKTNSALRSELVASHQGGALALDDVYTSSLCNSVKVLLKYRTATHYKSPEFLGPRIGDKIFSAILILSLYWRIGEETNARSMQSTAALLYFVVALCGYGAAAFVPSLTLDRPLFYRERADGCYTTTAYYIAKFLEEAFLCCFTSLFFSVIVFFSCSLQGNFGVFVLVYYLTTMIGIVLAYAIASAVPTMDAANALLPTYVTVCMYFGGLFLIFENIPIGWKWFSYLSFLRYSWCPLMVNQFENDMFNGILVFEGKSILDFYGLSSGIESSIAFSIGVLAVMMVFFAACGVLALKFINFSTR